MAGGLLDRSRPCQQITQNGPNLQATKISDLADTSNTKWKLHGSLERGKSLTGSIYASIKNTVKQELLFLFIVEETKAWGSQASCLKIFC